jgi:CYTH domain-containing protein
MVQLIRGDIMAKEIERKFLLPSIPNELITNEKRTIYQNYLAVGKEEVRIRRIHYENLSEKFYLTYKNRLKGKFVREEVEIEITSMTYDQLNNKSMPIIKDRLLISLDNDLWAEVDIYNNVGFELKTVEVEFKSVSEAECFTSPYWFGRELTGTGEYSNQSLWEGINGIK